MERSKIVFLLNDGVQAVRAVYEESGVKPTIFKTMENDLKVDDLVVVQSHTRHKMTVVKVTEVDIEIDFDSDDKVEWVVQKIDAPAFDEILKTEATAVDAVLVAERRRKKAELRKTMLGETEALKISDVP